MRGENPLIFIFMLTSQNSKILHGEWHRQRNRALADPTAFPATDERYALDDLGVADNEGGIFNKEQFHIDTNPMDGTPKIDKIDIRTRPGVD